MEKPMGEFEFPNPGDQASLDSEYLAAEDLLPVPELNAEIESEHQRYQDCVELLITHVGSQLPTNLLIGETWEPVAAQIRHPTTRLSCQLVDRLEQAFQAGSLNDFVKKFEQIVFTAMTLSRINLIVDSEFTFGRTTFPQHAEIIHANELCSLSDELQRALTASGPDRWSPSA